MSYREQVGFDEKAIVVGQVGNLSKHKRPDVLIRCFAKAYERIQDLRMVLIGDGPLYDELEGLIKQLGLEQVVKLMGYVPDVLPYYQHVMDINVLASSEEGLGISVIEASGCKLPSIVTDCTGLREVVDSEVTGITFSASEASQLTDGIVRLANNFGLRQRMGMAARLKAEECFSLDKYKSTIVSQIKSFVSA